MQLKFITIFVISQLVTAYALDASNYRLPTYVTPDSYNISLEVDPSEDTFNGAVIIALNWTNSKNLNVDSIRLHASPEYIHILSVSLNQTNCSSSEPDKFTEIVNITCPNLKDTNTNLTITYKGTFSTSDMYGFYKSNYTESNRTKTLVATQFEQTYARRAFPCFDEPEFKAKFTLSIKYADGYKVMSNTEVDHNVTVANTNTVWFKTTPKMSTYLLAFMVSEFEEFKEENLTEPYTFGVYARPDAETYTATAKTYGPKLLDLLGNYTGLPYDTLGNGKMDLVAIPDFAAGAMENWGLVTYREVDLLDEGNQTSSAVKQNVITVIAHELTHQWFGDYVTLDWWSDTWLNEGFAEYFQYHIANELIGEKMELDKQFVTLVHQAVMQVDSVASSQPLSSEESSVYTPAQDGNKFGSISYSKGASVIRMIKYILGEDKFRKGLQSYLKNNKYSNVDVNNLLTELQAVVNDTNVKLTQYLNTWIYKQGFPLITVSLNSSDSTLKIEATKQFLTTNEKVTSKSWFVPISYTTASKPDFENIEMNWLKPGGNMSFNDTNDWIIVNLQSSGFYRVNYDDTLWSRIITALKNKKEFEKIHVLNRAQLVDDIFNIATTGDVNYTLAFELVEYLNLETEYYPWYSALTAFRSILDKMSDPTLLQSKILNWLKDIVEIPSSSTTVTNATTHVDILKRSLLLEWACKLGHTECVKYAQDQFSAYKNNTSSMTDYNLRNMIFCNGLRYSKNASEDFDFLFNIYKKSNSPNEQNSLLTALGCAENATVLEKYLNYTIAPNSPIRKQDGGKAFAAVYSSSAVGVNASLSFLESNLTEIAASYKGMSAVSDIILGIAKKLSSPDQIDRLKNLISNNTNIEEIALVQNQAESIADSNSQWVATYSNQIQKLSEPNGAISNNIGTGLLMFLCYFLLKYVS